MNKQLYTPVRLSHLLSFSSVGSIVRGSHYLMVIKDTSFWKTKNGEPAGNPIFYVEQVKSVLGIQKTLRIPPIAREVEKIIDRTTCIPAQIFPSWMHCKQCHSLYYKPWRNIQSQEGPWYKKKNIFPLICPNSNCPGKGRSYLEQFPWVMIHKNGYLEDVPWHDLVHSSSSKKGGPDKEPNNCQREWKKPYLQIKPQKNSAGWLITCTKCQANADFFEQEQYFNGEPIYYNGRIQPWRQERAKFDSPDEKHASLVTINDPRVHYAEIQSALVIPPESRIRRGSVVDRLYSNEKYRKAMDELSQKNRLQQRSSLTKIAKELNCTREELEQAREKICQGYPLYGEVIAHSDLLLGEYKALLTPIPSLQEDEDFVPHHFTESWQTLVQSLESKSPAKQYGQTVETLVGVARLKEIMVFRGFHRYGFIDEDSSQAEETQQNKEQTRTLIPPDIDGLVDWLPALELYGEGLFFTLNKEKLAQWESQKDVYKQCAILEKRYAKSGLYFPMEPILSPRFMLLHTLAHGLIRTLESQAGYPAASLKERIYASQSLGMAGILIYVAVPDKVGSLGGLVELSDPKRFLPLLAHTYENMEWCSLDPVCSEHEGQGLGLLNKAACHGCALIPETSCQYNNVFLDRFFVKGARERGIQPIFAI